MRQIKFRFWRSDRPYMHYDPCYNSVSERLNDTFTNPLHDGVWMQFIGLKDKNGKEIYEGDIVRVPQFPRPLFVKWDSHGYFLFENICNEANLGGDNDEVIGNIYENPELLVEKANVGI